MTQIIGKDRKTAIVLFNLGGPDSVEAVQPFLFNLFNDKAIIGAPKFIRTPLAHLISRRRAKKKAIPIYNEMGGKSPILENTYVQAAALEAALSKHGEAKTFICMRYWHPMSTEMVAKVKDYAPDHIILLPLYPQFSTTTTGSSVSDWQAQARKQKLNVPTTTLCCYPTQGGWIDALVDLIRPAYVQAAKHAAPRLLFSAHGLPEKIIAKGDPYQWQVEETTKAVIEKLSIPDLDAVNCYQSRVGPLKWIGPNTEEVLIETARRKQPIVLVPLAFVSEHSETLVELDIEYKELVAEHWGEAARVESRESGVNEKLEESSSPQLLPEGEGVSPLASRESLPYFRVPTVSVHPRFIEGLAELCLGLKIADRLCSERGGRMCPTPWKQCPHAA